MEIIHVLTERRRELHSALYTSLVFRSRHTEILTWICRLRLRWSQRGTLLRLHRLYKYRKRRTNLGDRTPHTSCGQRSKRAWCRSTRCRWWLRPGWRSDRRGNRERGGGRGGLRWGVGYRRGVVWGGATYASHEAPLTTVPGRHFAHTQNRWVPPYVAAQVARSVEPS